MSTYEAAYKSLLQGVSQQLPEERLPGQLTAQSNMMSDPVTNLRRRPGIRFNKDWEWVDANPESIIGWFTDIAGSRVHILLNTATGNIRVLDETFTEVGNVSGGVYLTTSNIKSIRATSVGNEFFLANTSVKPTLSYNTTTTDPKYSGFFYIVAGAFSKGYSVSIVHPDGSLEASYTTPSGTGAGDASLSTPEYIANQLYTQLVTGAFNRVRFESITITPDWEPYVGALQFNVGSSAAPNWQPVTVGGEVDVADINNGRLRVNMPIHFEPGDSTAYSGGFYSFTFKVRVNGVWSTAVYSTTNTYTYDANTVLPVTYFTAHVASSGDALLVVGKDGPYVFVTRTGTGISVNSSVGTGFMITSKASVVSGTGQLPARLPSAANGFICKVGTGDNPQYYRYNHATTEWVETAEWGSPTGITNMPVSLALDSSEDWIIKTTEFEGRNAGDGKSNEAHEFMTQGITGMGTYQGRLVLLSGPMVSMSASNKPRRFFRSTVTSLINSDPIEIGSGMNSAAAYEYAMPFQKDLLLFSQKYQAVVPSGNTAITPSNATVVPTSTHEVDTTSSPIAIGRTLLYCNPRSENFFGVLEMIPSSYTDSQYVSQDSTPHLPKYMAGRCRFSVASGVASLAVFAPTGDLNTLVVHEYHWDGDNKVQQAWHTWSFEYPVAAAYFAADKIIVVFVMNERTIIGSIDPRAGALYLDGTRRPFLDLYVQATIVDNVITIPAWMLAFDPAIASKLKAIVATGDLAGELVGASPSVDGLSLNTVLSHPSGTVLIGVPYYSGIIPTPPIVTDYNQETIHSGKATLLRFMIGTKNSSEFEVQVNDNLSSGDELAAPTLSWSSRELELGKGLFADTAITIVPCRTDLRSTAMEVSTQGTGELNITSLEYIAKYHSKVKRR